MWIFYTFALLPLLVGAFILWKDDNVTWQEWLGGAAAAFLLAAIMHMTAIWGMTSDIETLSGEITKVSHYPRWVEEYEESHSETTTDSDGKTHTRTWTTTEHDTHYEHWVATRDFGGFTDERNIEQGLYNEISHKFGGDIVNDGKQSTSHFGGSFDGGDNNIYSTFNKTGYIYPVTTTKTFENRIKAAPSVFSFVKVPTNINVYPWPSNDDWMRSDRLCGTASLLVSNYKWDCLNSKLGAMKKVNLIMVGFGNEGSEYGQWQQAKWIGGKKNDLVICYGGATRNKKPDWVYVFGWTEKEIVKQNLQSLLMDNVINDNLLPLIEKEVIQHYTIKDWSKFDYIAIQPPTWSYWVYFILMAISQGGLYYFFHVNEYGKIRSGSYYRGRGFNY